MGHNHVANLVSCFGKHETEPECCRKSEDEKPSQVKGGIQLEGRQHPGSRGVGISRSGFDIEHPYQAKKEEGCVKVSLQLVMSQLVRPDRRECKKKRRSQ